MINLWFTKYHTWYSKWSTISLQKNVWKVIKLRFWLSKTFWPRCRLMWTASWRFCMNSFGQRWQRNSWKVHRNFLYFLYSQFKVHSSLSIVHQSNIGIWTFIPRCCRSWFSRALCRRNLKKSFSSCLKKIFLTSYHILHACIGKVFLQCVWLDVFCTLFGL